MPDSPDRLHVPRWLALPLALALLAVIALVAAPFVARSIVPRVSETEVQTAVVSTIQSEAPEAFLVTGTLRSALTTTVATTRRLLPDLLGLELGRSEVEVRVPGRIAYGFDTRAVTASDVRLVEGADGSATVRVALPPLAVFSTEPVLEEATLRAESGGWIKPSRDAEREALREALGRVRPALRRQGEAHLRESAQPARNAAEAVAAQLRGPLAALGLEAPAFEFALPGGETLRLAPEAPAERVIVVPQEG